MMSDAVDDVIVDIRSLRKYFPVKTGLLQRVTGHVRTGDDVSLSVRGRETLGLVGESGCGKTTLGRSVARAIPATSGEVWYRPRSGGEAIDFLQADKTRMRALRQEIQMVFRDPYSSLDVSAQAQVVNLLEELQAKFGLTFIFVAHDLSEIQHISNRVAVMYVGRVVELASTDDLFSTPLHPYTEALMSAVPKPDPRRKVKRIVLEGEVPNPAAAPSGCHFHPRCRFAKEVCSVQRPEFREVRPGHHVSCHFAGELALRGV